MFVCFFLVIETGTGANFIAVRLSSYLGTFYSGFHFNKIATKNIQKILKIIFKYSLLQTVQFTERTPPGSPATSRLRVQRKFLNLVLKLIVNFFFVRDFLLLQLFLSYNRHTSSCMAFSLYVFSFILFSVHCKLVVVAIKKKCTAPHNAPHCNGV